MLCQSCQKRIANVHFVQVVNNNKLEMYLCDLCAKDKGQFGFESPLNINDFFSSLIGFGNQNLRQAAAESRICEGCGMSYDEFTRLGKLGCSRCYERYGEKLDVILRRLHGNPEHRGKTPKKLSESLKMTKEIEVLRDTLSKAIQNEEYEKAAEIRDRIRSLEVGL